MRKNAAGRFSAKIERLRRTLPALYAGITRGLQEELLEETQKRTPEDDGELKKRWATLPITKQGGRYIIAITNPQHYAAYVEFGYMQRPGMILRMKEINGKLRFLEFLGYSKVYRLGEPNGKVPPDENGEVVIVTRKRFIPGHFMARDALEEMKSRWANHYRKSITAFLKRAFEEGAR